MGTQRPHVVAPGTWRGRGSPQSSVDLPRRNVAAVVTGGTCRVAVPGGWGLKGSLWRGLGGWADTGVGMGGAALGGKRGSGSERPVGGAAIPCAGAVRGRGDCGLPG